MTSFVDAASCGRSDVIRARRGDIHQYFTHSVAAPPNVDRPLGGTLPPERERESDKETQEAESREQR